MVPIAIVGGTRSDATLTRYELPEPEGGAYYGKGDIRVDSALDPALFRAVVLHELGHFAGMPHTPSGAMRAELSPEGILTDADLRECLRLRLCLAP